jgi:hypothetical protein
MLAYETSALEQEKVLQQGWDRLQHHFPATLKDAMVLAVKNGTEDLADRLHARVTESVNRVVCGTFWCWLM